MGFRSRKVVVEAASRLFPEVFPGLPPLPLGPVDASALDRARQLLGSLEFDAWTESLSRVGNCAHPIRLVGSSTRVDRATGEVLSTYSSADEPDRVTRIRCNNRRASVCPSCSRLYQGDTFALLRAGMVGGKTVPLRVAQNPLVFATFTAPTFGAVHGRRDSGPCRPRRSHRLCPHGRPTDCRRVHSEDDPELGQPLCAECYDYPSQVVWQWMAPSLWQRFTVELNRAVARCLGVPRDQQKDVATVQYAKVAEYQLRGAVHFHALIRLDGPKTEEGFEPAPDSIDARRLAEIVRDVGRSVRLTAPPVDENDAARVLAFGRQLDVRPVNVKSRPDRPEQPLTPEQAAGYLAKYATKAAGDTVTAGNRHHVRLQHTVRGLSRRSRHAAVPDHESKYDGLDRWVPSLGFRGHFGTKSRRYSLTYTAMRRARARARAWMAAEFKEGRTVDLAALEDELLAAEDETTLVIGSWTFAGAGWADEGQTLLAKAAAARAREYDQERAEERRNQSDNSRKETP